MKDALVRLKTAADSALTPVVDSLAARQPSDRARGTLAHDVRAAIPDHADRILDDSAWPALATVLADAEAGGHEPHQLLKEAAAQRELTTARQPALVLITRVRHTSRNPAPNPRAEAARLRSTMGTQSLSWPRQPPLSPSRATPAELRQRGRR